MSSILWFKELSKDSIFQVGGKGSNLGEMYNIGLPIPPGFVVSAQAFKSYIESTGIDKKIFAKLKGLEVDDTEALQKTSKEIQEIIIKTKMSKELKNEILEAYDAMGVREGQQLQEVMDQPKQEPYVAVRSSATAEDLPEASFAGQQATYLNVRGPQRLIAAVTACWASLYTARAIFYRVKNNFPHEKVFIAVVVQKMVHADSAGIIFSANPVTDNRQEVLIESSFGLGEAVVSGSITPDEFIVDKNTGGIKGSKIAKKTWMLVTNPEKMQTEKKEVPSEEQESPSLTEDQTKKLAELAVNIEEHYGKPQDLEFAIEKGEIYITQSRPITTLSKKVSKAKEKPTKGLELKDANLLVSGIPASPGIGKGKVVIVHGIDELSKVKEGHVLVSRMTNPDYVAAMKRASAIVTDAGGATAHAAIVSREMGIPCVVGTEVATSKLKDGDFVTVDATKGKVYEGDIKLAEEKQEKKRLDIKTKTKIMVIMDLPEFAERAAATGADGVGLLRGEFINMSNKIHPIHMIESGRKEEFIENLNQKLKKVCRAFKGKTVWYRTIDAPTDEFRNLKGGENEPQEDNPMLGWRSIRRSLDQPELLKAEYEAVKRAHMADCNHIGIMIPLVTHVDQVKQAKKIFEETTGLVPGKDIDFGVMVETPAAVQIIEDICREGVSFVSLGTNDLTQFTLALDRNSAKVQKLYDEMHPAILKQIHKVIKACKHYHVHTSICGQAGSRPEMAKFLFDEGIDSISANPDAVYSIRKMIAKLEGKLKNNNSH